MHPACEQVRPPACDQGNRELFPKVRRKNDMDRNTSSACFPHGTPAVASVGSRQDQRASSHLGESAVEVELFAESFFKLPMLRRLEEVRGELGLN